MKNKFWLLVALAILLRVVLSFIIWHPDLNNHVDWGIRFWQYGPKDFYTQNVWSFTWPNQPPGTMYLFAAVRKLFEFVFNVFWIINVKIPQFPSIIVSYFETNLYPALLKLPAILSDLGIAYLIYKFTNKKWASLLWLFNPVVWYNSAVWGQYDALINFLILLSFYLLIKKKLTLSALAFALSIYTKASLLIFAPIWLIVALKQKNNFKKYLWAIIVTLILIVLLSLPFSKGNPLTWLYMLYKDKVFTQQLHVITANAFNLWSGIAGIDERPDTLPFLGLTYQIWGYILFSLSYVLILIKTYKDTSTKNINWMLALAAFSSFILLTNMHERYLYPLFPYLTMLVGWSLVSWKYYFWISLINLLNLYNLWFTPRSSMLVDLLEFQNKLLPRIFGVVLTVIFVLLYQKQIPLKLKKKN